MYKKIILIIVLISNYANAQIDLSAKLIFSLNEKTNEKKSFTSQDLIVSSPVNTPARNYYVAENKTLVSPKIIKIPKISILPFTKIKSLDGVNAQVNIMPVAPLTKIKDPIIKVAEASAVNLTEIAETEYKMIQALIFFELQKKYDVAMSLFIELADSHIFKYQARMLYTESAQALGLSKEYRHKTLQLVNESHDKSINSKITQNMVKNIRAFETTDIKKIDGLVSSFNIDISKNDNYLYMQAKHLIAEGNLSAAENILSMIGSKSDLYMDAVLLLTSVHYRKGEVAKAISKLEKVIPTIENNNPNNKQNNLVRNSLIATLARLYFQKGKYKESYKNYLKINRSSPLWLQSVIEQAWAQILAGDHIGAAGNMFSLHTEVFKKAYLPESYIVRSVGYLNLCQYGDALHVLTDLDHRFKQIHEKLLKFQSENQSAQAYYNLVKTWFTNSNQSEINSLPRSFVAELAAHPSFTNIQERINYNEEEGSQFDKIVTDFSAKEASIKQKIISLKNEVQTLKNQKASAEILARNEIKTLAHDIELQIVKRGLVGFKKARTNSVNRLESEKQELRNKAALSIKSRYSEFVSILGKFLEQEEILAYEIYSGAGEHIRYQMANGKIDDRTPTALTPEEKKSYKWKFRGEVWEDEIGHYRSSLKNVCANDNIAQLKGDQ